MAKRLHTLFAKGTRSNYAFDVYVSRATAQELRDDGLEVYEVENKIPASVVNLGLVSLWCFVQNLYHFKNPFN